MNRYVVTVSHVQICDTDKNKLECMTEDDIRDYIFENGAEGEEDIFDSLDEARKAFGKECDISRWYITNANGYTLFVDYIELQELDESEADDNYGGTIDIIDYFVANKQGVKA